MSGYIYCFSNDTMEGVYKIGFTTRTPLMRLKEANRGDTWSLSNKFTIEFAKEVGDCREKERKIHKLLSLVGERVCDNREFFKISLDVVRSVFELMDGRWYNIESDEKRVIEESDSNIVEENVTENECVSCDVETANVENVVNKHIDVNITREEANVTQEDIITCGVCSKMFKTLQTYKQHLSYNRCNKKRIPRKIDSKCKYCMKEFKTKQNKQRHEEKCPEHKRDGIRYTLLKIKNIVNSEMTSI